MATLKCGSRKTSEREATPSDYQFNPSEFPTLFILNGYIVAVGYSVIEFDIQFGSNASHDVPFFCDDSFPFQLAESTPGGS